MVEPSVAELVVKKHKKKPSALISILQDIQKEAGYLPASALKEVAREMQIPFPQVYGVATFFKSLSLVPQGRHQVTVCLGTACHVRAAARLLAEVAAHLGVAPGETTQDGEFTLKAVNCLGVCAIGPVMMIDDKYYGRMTPSRVRKLLRKRRS